MITVLGATGHTGGRVTAQLRAAGEKVRAVGRSAERKYVRLPDAELINLLTGVGLPADLAELHVGMNRAFNEGVVVSRSGRTPETTTPTSLAEFASDYR